MIALIVKYARENLALIIFEGPLVAITPCRWLELVFVLHAAVTVLALSYAKNHGWRPLPEEMSPIVRLLTSLKGLAIYCQCKLIPITIIAILAGGVLFLFWVAHISIRQVCCV